MNLALIKIRADMARQRRLFDLRDGHLGADLCKAATDGVQDSLAGQHAPDGSPWPPLSQGYANWKGTHFPGQPMGVLHGVLADPKEVAGEVSVSEDLAEVTYGITQQARDEAAGFSVARPFWGFTKDSLDDAKRILDARFDTIR